MLKRNFIGIDPGKAGGIAVVNEDGSIGGATDMPATIRDLIDVLNEMAYEPAIGGELRTFAFLEFVRSSPKMGVVSAFTFGRGLGHVEASLVSVGIPYDDLTPQRWQQGMSCRSGGDKNVTKARAQQLWPRWKITHAIADALLIAEYGRRLKLGMLHPATRQPSTRTRGR